MRRIVLNDSSINKYIPLLRKVTSKPISEIKHAIKLEKPVIECDYYDENQLLTLVKSSEQLPSLGAKIKIYENEREISLEMVKNLIETYVGIAEDRERLDDILFGNDVDE